MRMLYCTFISREKCYDFDESVSYQGHRHFYFLLGKALCAYVKACIDVNTLQESAFDLT